MEMMSSIITADIKQQFSSVPLICRLYVVRICGGKSTLLNQLARSTPRPTWAVPQQERRNITEKDYEDWILRGEISDTEGKGNWKRREYEKYITEDSPIHLSGGKGSDKERTGTVLHSRMFYQEANWRRLEQTANKEQLRESSCYNQGHGSSTLKKLLLCLILMSGCAATTQDTDKPSLYSCGLNEVIWHTGNGLTSGMPMCVTCFCCPGSINKYPWTADNQTISSFPSVPKYMKGNIHLREHMMRTTQKNRLCQSSDYCGRCEQNQTNLTYDNRWSSGIQWQFSSKSVTKDIVLTQNEIAFSGLDMKQLIERKKISYLQLDEILIAGSTYIWIIPLVFCLFCLLLLQRKAAGYCDNKFSMKNCEKFPVWINMKWISCFLFLMTLCACTAESNSMIIASRMQSVESHTEKVSIGNLEGFNCDWWCGHVLKIIFVLELFSVLMTIRIMVKVYRCKEKKELLEKHGASSVKEKTCSYVIMTICSKQSCFQLCCQILFLLLFSTKFEGWYQEPWKTSFIIMGSCSYMFCLFRSSQISSKKKDEIMAWRPVQMSNRDQTRGETANKQSTRICSDNDWDIDVKKKAIPTETLGIKKKRSKDNLSSLAETEQLENGSEELNDIIRVHAACNIAADHKKEKEVFISYCQDGNSPVVRHGQKSSKDLNDTIKVHPVCDIAANQTKGKEFCTPGLEDSNSPVVNNGQNDVCGIQDDKDQNESLTTDETTENINTDWNEDLSTKTPELLLVSFHQELGIKKNTSGDTFSSIALTDDPEDGAVNLRDVTKVHQAYDMPANSMQPKEFSTGICKDSLFPVVTCGQYEMDDASGIWDGKDQKESLRIDGKSEICNRYNGHESTVNEVNNTKIVDNKHQEEDCLCISKSALKTVRNQTEEIRARVWGIIMDSGCNVLGDKDSSADDSLHESDIEDYDIQRKENEETVCDEGFGSQGLISQWEDTQVSNGIQEFKPIDNRLRESDKTSNPSQGISNVIQNPKPDSAVTLAESSGFDRLREERNDQHLLQYKILDHKPVKSLKSKPKSVPMENLHIRDSQLRGKTDYEKQKKGKYTYMHKMLHHVSLLPVPKLELAVFMNESAEFFEPVLDIVDLIADGKDPGPQVTMQYELLRICTLRNYPKDNKPFLIHFAKAGFYYAAEGDEVICYCCGLRRHSWLATDLPYRIHQRINPNCKFLNRNSEFNVPITYSGTTKNLDKLDKLLIRLEEENKPPQATTDAEGGNDLSEYVPPQALSGALNNPKHRQYISKAQRLSSYEGWPDNLIQTPEIMAEAGFYYAGFGDCVRCYYCGIGLRHWTAEDNVWIEHARWSKHCAFLKQEKGQEFINLVHMAIKYTQDDDEQPVIAASNPDDKETPKNGESEQNLVEKILLTDPAQSVLEMGYTPKIIKKAIAFILNRDGRSGISSQTIMEKVLEFEEAETAKSLAGELANMDLSRQNNTSGGPDSGSSLKSNQKSKPSAGKTSKGLGDTSAKPGISCKDSRSKSIKEENEKLKGQTLCRVCTTNTVCIVLLPCGHLCACDECGSALRTCPMCNRDVKGTVKTYMS